MLLDIASYQICFCSQQQQILGLFKRAKLLAGSLARVVLGPV